MLEHDRTESPECTTDTGIVGNTLPRSRLRTRKNPTERFRDVRSCHLADDHCGRSDVYLPLLWETLTG
jgi:hypothetical protein